MPDSKTMPIERELEKEVARATSKLQFFREISALLPPHCGAPDRFMDHGYCADVTLTFAQPEHFTQLLKAFPALPVYWLLGDNRTYKPASALRGHEWNEDYLRIYPVTLLGPNSSYGEGARWWTMLGEKRIAIEMPGVARAQILADKRDYRGVLEHGAEGFLPRLTQPQVRPSAATAFRSMPEEERGALSEASALEAERGEVEGIRAFLEKEIFSKGRISSRSQTDMALYYEYLVHAIEAASGIRCAIPFMEHEARTDTVELRLAFDTDHPNESFYDIKVKQNPAQRLKLRDIPVTYVI